MFKPIRWKTFPLDLLRIQVGFTLYGLAITLMIRGNLGTSAWPVLEVALSRILRYLGRDDERGDRFCRAERGIDHARKIGWGTLGNILSIGPWEDFWLARITPVTDNLPLQIAMLLGSIALIGLASAIYIGVDAGAGPRDSLMLAIKRTTGLSIRTARGMIEVTVVTIGWLLGGPAGIGTLVYALLVGSAIQLGFKLLIFVEDLVAKIETAFPG